MQASHLPDQLVMLAGLLRHTITALSSAPHFPLSTVKERDNFRDVLDTGIQFMFSLKMYRNDVTAISFLPDELLSEIFYQVMLENPWSTKWAVVIRVCRRWHKVAMTHGRLWSWISQLGYGQHTRGIFYQEALSQGAPLSLGLGDPIYSHMVIRNVHRIVRLRLDGPNHKIRHFLEGVDYLPSLTTLQIDGRESEDDDDAWYLPGFILTGGAPRLSQLRLQNVHFQQLDHLKYVNNFTHLELLNGDIERISTLPPLHEIYDLIQRSPRLQLLRLRNFIAPVQDGQPIFLASSAAPISLPFMEFLEIRDVSSDVTSVLTFLRLPPSTRMSLFIARTPDTHLTYAQQLKPVLLQVRLHIIRNPTIAPLRSAVLDRSNYMIFAFSHKESCPEPIFGTGPEKPDIHILTWPQSQHDIRQMLTQIVNFLPLDQLHSLNAVRLNGENFNSDPDSIERGITMQAWRALLRLLPSDLTVTIGVNDGMEVLLQAVLDTMRSCSTAQHKTRRQKKQRQRIGLGSRPVSKFILWASLHPKLITQRCGSDSSEEPYDPEEDQKALYSSIQRFLSEYANLETPLKPRGAYFPSLEFTRIEHGCVRAYTVADELFTVTGELVLDERVWDPVENKRLQRKHRRHVRKLRMEIPGLPESDSELSALSEHESEVGG